MPTNSSRRNWWHYLTSAGGLLDDGAIRYGVKFGLAGVLAVFVALVLKLDNPTWALFTVYVLMIAQYVGAIAEKAFFRFVGTVVGGVLGYILTASFEQNPVIYLTLMALLVGFCTAMFGQGRYPYAFFLCGMTALVVASNGLSDPDSSWKYMLWRIEEVSLGVLVTLLVQSILWPRFARKEFLDNFHSACVDLRECLKGGAPLIFNKGENKAIVMVKDFPARITGLRQLLQFGSRESIYFRERLPTYYEMTCCLSRMALSIVTLDHRLTPDSFYSRRVTATLPPLHQALIDALDNLATPGSTEDSRRGHLEAIQAAFTQFESEMEAAREESDVSQVPTEDAVILGVHGLALADLRHQIERLHELLNSLPEEPTVRSKEIEPMISSKPSAFWIRSGIKGGLMVAIAFVINDWCEPPGGTMFMLGAWVFTVMNALSPGGQGDRRAFQYTAYTIVVLLLLSLLLIAGTPVLSSYAAMNIVIFTWLFIWGYVSYTTKGVTIPMQLAMLASIGILGLNAQQPVDFQSIVGFFFGIALAQLLAAVFARVLWPSLPQWELRDRFVNFIQLCRQTLTEGPEKLVAWQRVRIALIPGEAQQRINVLQAPICPPDEPPLLTEYLHRLQRFEAYLIGSIGKLRPLLPRTGLAINCDCLDELEKVMGEHLLAHERGFADSTKIEVSTDSLQAALDKLMAWIKETRLQMLERDYPINDAMHIMGLAGRYELAARQLLEAAKEAGRLRLPLYMGDYEL